ncbi:MAG TPA: hypothetical protein VIG30_14795 [Ktedonobacterales bacterium]|jgi:hypothetical protein
MDTEPLLITLARALDREHVDYRVFGQPSPGAGAPAKERAPHTELATIELNRRICFPDGRVLAILHRGGLLSGDRELRRALSALDALAAPPAPSTPTTRRSSNPPRGQPVSPEPPLAILHRERTGLLGHRHILIVAGAEGDAGERRFLLRRRYWFGSPANVDVVPLLGHDGPPEPVLLHAEKSGTWRQRLRANWLAPKELSLPVVLFVLNALADLDRRAAVAASAGAAGV